MSAAEHLKSDSAKSAKSRRLILRQVKSSAAGPIIRKGGAQAGKLGFREAAASVAGAFLSLLLIAWLAERLQPGAEKHLLLAAFGSSAILIFALPQSPYAKPWPAIFGHVAAAAAGVFLRENSTLPYFINFPLVVALALTLMILTRSLHPPAGGTAVMALAATDAIKDLGYLVIVFPMTAGMLTMVFTAVVFNNLIGGRRYPRRT